MKKIIFIIPVIVLIGCKTEDEVVKEFACDPETVTYESQVYNTVQIGDQCWLKENLNVGTMVGGFWVKMTDNGIKEKYCYNGNPDYCAIYGGLYNWNEMMQYTTQQGSQGICPSGWHLPTDEEWKVLDGIDLSGFSGLPGGYRGNTDLGFCFAVGNVGYWWSSTEHDSLHALYRLLTYSNQEFLRHNELKDFSFSVRCLRD